MPTTPRIRSGYPILFVLEVGGTEIFKAVSGSVPQMDDRIAYTPVGGSETLYKVERVTFVFRGAPEVPAEPPFPNQTSYVSFVRVSLSVIP